ncbi:LytTR family transcriptional regulator [Lutibacter sp.]|uniref:LytTR family transcriptional regulator n=1 Tax=Lutibacter sp. TaxID=1925666 RepID=UPI0027338932|nr:LytTR family transcriptional regulator [Lutibacter sp.]MDP3312159.1 LytTR family transcriptional regulator [Lutibacter sp.]
MNYLIKVSTSQFLEIQIESSQREAREFSNLVSFQIANGTHRDTIINNIQKSIEGTNIESGFICMFDWSGVEICHPDPQKIGKKVSPNESYVRPLDDGIDSEDFYQLLKNKEQRGGLREFSTNRSSEIIYLYPVKNSDWIIAAHANIDKIDKEINKLKVTFILVYLLTGISIILLSVIFIRYLSNYFEKELELKNQLLMGEVLTLSKLNANLTDYRNKINEKIDTEIDLGDENDEGSKIKKRVLTYVKDKLISIKVEQIAFIFTELSITSIMCLDGKKYTSNSSLDELYSSLDHSIFFRANRQYIISVKAIDEILKYGNNQLKIKTKLDTAIIISKNTASEFKKWLNS